MREPRFAGPGWFKTTGLLVLIGLSGIMLCLCSPLLLPIGGR